MSELRIDPSGSADYGPCECCGGQSRTVWGYVYRGADPAAAYFVQWTSGQVDRHGANFDLILGLWGDGTTRSDRELVSLAYRRTEAGTGFMIVDSANRPAASSDLAGTALSRTDVVGTPLAKATFEIVDALLAQDERIAEILRVV